MRRWTGPAAFFLSSLAIAPAAEAGNWWFGGGIGIGLGDQDFFEVNGIVGYQATPRFTPGLRLTYRNREFTRAGQKFTTDDYGAALFGRYRVWKPIFAQLEYEVLSYEFLTASGTERETYDSVLGGGGVSFALSRNLSFFALALYNFSYDSDEIRGPYDSEWIFRTGIGYSF